MVNVSELKIRMAFVGAILFGLYLYVAQLFMSAGVDAVWVLAGLVGFVAVQYKLGRWLTLRSVNARELSNAEFPRIHRTVEELCRSMELQKPRLLIATMGTPNAFAVGRRGAGVVVLSESLIEVLDDEELEGVIAHELAHLDNRDVVLMVLGQAIATLVGFLVFLGVRVVGRRSFIVAILAWVLGSIAQFFVSLLVLAMSRYREYVADDTAARHTGRPQALASALSKISTLGKSDLTQPVDDTVNALCISGGPSSLLSTHPPMEKRIDRLAPGYEPAVSVDELVQRLQPEDTCPNCEAMVDPGWSLCDACGESLDDLETGIEPVRRQEGRDHSANTRQPPAQPGGTEATACPGCGMTVDDGWEFCEQCGTPLR